MCSHFTGNVYSYRNARALHVIFVGTTRTVSGRLLLLVSSDVCVPTCRCLRACPESGRSSSKFQRRPVSTRSALVYVMIVFTDPRNRCLFHRSTLGLKIKSRQKIIRTRRNHGWSDISPVLKFGGGGSNKVELGLVACLTCAI